MSYQKRVHQFSNFVETRSLILKIKKPVYYSTESLSFLENKIWDVVTKKLRIIKCKEILKLASL